MHVYICIWHVTEDPSGENTDLPSPGDPIQTEMNPFWEERKKAACKVEVVVDTYISNSWWWHITLCV
jgi:hypothetical protein